MLLEIIATLAAGLFAGAAIYIDLAEQPARKQIDIVAAHWTVSGTQTERLATVTGRTIPPTRRRATVSGVLLTEVRDGKIVRERWYWDQLSLLDQLGIMEHPGLFLTHEGF